MKLAIMQPYFFPYIGYWQLIAAVDTFILFDDVQYQRRGWINRNRILKHGGGWQYITVPVRKHLRSELIRNIYAKDDSSWKNQILRQLEHYAYKKNAKFYNETVEIIKNIFKNITSERIVEINYELIMGICKYLDITTNVQISSSLNFNYKEVHDAGEWALRIAEQTHAQEYINPIDGAKLFDMNKFRSSNIQLGFLKKAEISYDQGQTFEPWLSIIDILMFNGPVGTQKLTNNFSIESAR